MTRFRILQINDIAGCAYAFRGYREDKFNIEDYQQVYDLESESMDDISDLEALEILFHLFNMQRPEDFTGHSLSISDCVHIERNGKCRLYYCDLVGWTLIKETRA